MQFNSIIFLIFISLFFLVWPFAKKRSHSRWLFMTIMSLLFYGWWDWRFIFLILFSGTLDYVCGLWMHCYPKKAKILLAVSLAGNLGSLAFFKYTYFLLDVLNDVLFLMGVEFVIPEPGFSIVLPVGISFYTFQSLSYTLDIYKGRLSPTKNYLHFMSYLTMFPQLVAGPIIRAKDLLHQLSENRITSKIAQHHGLKLIAYGLFQKAVIADNLGYMVDRVFQAKTIHDGTPLIWVTMVAFSFQIFCDFSGYSLMARGMAKLMGYHFKMNFNHPYLAIGFKDFWQRWHISLSSWFRDYVYIPLGGNKKGLARSIVYMTATMIVSGIWHGANLTFVVWGAMHALFLTMERVLRPERKLSQFIIWGYTFAFVLIAWVFFRSDSLFQATEVLKEMFAMNMSWTFVNEFFDAEVMLIIAVLIEIYVLFKRKFVNFYRLTKSKNLELIKVPIALASAIYFRGPEAGFIYFQF